MSHLAHYGQLAIGCELPFVASFNARNPDPILYLPFIYMAIKTSE
jgi:hypothetical protein